MLQLAYVLGGLRSIKCMYYNRMYGKTAHKYKREAMEAAFKESLKHNRLPMRRAISAVIERGSVVSRLQEIERPTKILWGDEDIITTPKKYSDQLKEGIRGAQFEEIKQTGHLVDVESPELLIKRIRDFLPQCQWKDT